jgi:hypothetical protein
MKAERKRRVEYSTVLDAEGMVQFRGECGSFEVGSDNNNLVLSHVS